MKSVCAGSPSREVGESTAPYPLKGPRNEIGWRSVSSGGGIIMGLLEVFRTKS